MSTLDLFVDLISEVETYCQYDFDFVSEDIEFISGQFFSDEVLTKNVPIADFEESVGNRVLSIDSFQDEFNNTQEAPPFSVIDTFPLAGTRYRNIL